MNFDPEKVERWDIYPDIGDEEFFYAEEVGTELHRHPNAREFVSASDYDQLLKLYREAKHEIKLLESYEIDRI